MGLRISTNVASINAQRSLATTSREISKSFAQLSSGSRITKAADDSAGLAISETMRSHIRGYAQASRNAQDGISMVQVAEGGLGEISNIMTRFRELGVQAASDTIGDTERGFVNKEVMQLKEEADRIAKSTRFGKTNLLDGSGGMFAFQVDVNNDDKVDRIHFNAGENSATLDSLGLSSIDFSDKEGARDALGLLDDAQTKVNGYRANLGAIQNRLISTTDNIGVQMENLSAANSRIRDTDIAAASADLTKNNIMQNAATAVVGQANQSSQLALKLIG